MSATDPTLSPLDPRGAGPELELGRRKLLERMFEAPGEHVQIGRYVVIDRLGAGAMGAVYSAYDERLDRRIALKVLDRVVEDDSALREARALAKLNHPEVVRVYEVGVADGHAFVAMEFVEGKSLRRWQTETARPWPQLVQTYLRAGRGLAAAHAAGIFHRDFKPDNVIVGEHGEVKVIDFGLATAPTVDEDDPAASLGDPAIAGTPAYMSPEQLRGEGVDARADQFAFCVALHEALWGMRPFEGDSLAALMANVFAGRRRDPQDWRSSPGWLRAAVLQGLAVAPADRHASMTALLATLARGQRRNRLRKAGVGLLVAGATVGAWWGHGQFDERERVAACEATGAAIDAVWNEARRAELHAGIAASGAANADATAERVVPWLDTVAGAWRDTATQSCLDAQVRRLWNPDLVARSNSCLEDHRLDLDALIEQLSHADVTTTHEAVKAAAGLPSIDACRDPEQLRRMPSVPEDLDDVRAVREQLARARALRASGKFAEGIEVASAAVADAEALGWAPLAANGKVLLATLLDEAGRFAEAEAMLEAAYFEARELDLAPVAVAAANRLVYTVGHRAARARDGRWWAKHVEVAFVHAGVGRASLERGEAWSNLATIDLMDGDLDAARVGYEKDLAIREQLLGPEHPEVAESLSNLAVAHAMMGHFEQARPLFERALAIQEAVLGPEHPSVAIVLNNLGGVLEGTGATADAVPIYRRALAIQEKVVGRQHPGTANVMHSLGNALAAVDQPEEARMWFERALAVWEASVGPEHPDVALPLNTLAMLDTSAGDLAGAKAKIERALAILEKARGPENPEVGATLSNLADVHAALGRYDEARALHQRALAILEAALGPEHPHLTVPLRGLVSVALAQGRGQDAIAAAERAVALESADPIEQAHARFALAQVLGQAGTDRERARLLAEQARDALAGRADATRSEIDAWLAQPGGEG